jgi:carbon storage regulator CsrA
VIGNDIRIKVLEIRGGKARIGIVAPEDVVVDRQEIHEKRMGSLNGQPDPTIYQPVS